MRAFDAWIRGDFAAINTALEELYFARPDRAAVRGVGEVLKAELLAEGGRHVTALLAEGNTDEGFERGFDLLGNVGMFMAACRRHEISDPAQPPETPLAEASALAMQIGAALGVSPRFASSHLTTHNRARGGRYKSFTTLADEHVFIDYNTRGVLAFKRAADALMRTLPLGISHPVLPDLLRAAAEALAEVAASNARLAAELDVDRFFYCVRPYYKPYRVGFHVYRGANAGDFAGINIIDLLLGVCRADHAEYSQLLVDKFLFMLPEDQALLRDCLRRRSLMDRFLDCSATERANAWYQRNLRAFLAVCEAHAHTASQHHEQLVQRFIVTPAQDLPPEHLADLTASGPPLPVLLRSLEWLRDMRTAAPRRDIPTRHADLQRLRRSLRRPAS